MSVVTSLPWSFWLLQAGTVPDTTYTKLVTDRSWFDVLITVEQAIVPLLLILLLGAIAAGVYKATQGIKQVTQLLQSSTADLSGAAHSIRNVAEDVKGITASVRGDVEAVGETVRDVNQRIRSAVSVAEERIRRFDTLVEVAQEEAEDFVVSAAATLRGVRAGASVLRQSFLFTRGNGLFRKRRKKGWRERAALRERERHRDRRHAEREARAAQRERHSGENQPRIRSRVPDES